MPATPAPDARPAAAGHAASSTRPARRSPSSSPSAAVAAGWLNLLLGAAALIAVGGVAFAIGRTTAPADAVGLVPGVIVNGGPSPAAASTRMPARMVRPGGPGFVGAGGPTIEGTVTAIDADSITITLASGDEVTIGHRRRHDVPRVDHDRPQRRRGRGRGRGPGGSAAAFTIGGDGQAGGQGAIRGPAAART